MGGRIGLLLVTLQVPVPPPLENTANRPSINCIKPITKKDINPTDIETKGPPITDIKHRPLTVKVSPPMRQKAHLQNMILPTVIGSDEHLFLGSIVRPVKGDMARLARKSATGRLKIDTC